MNNAPAAALMLAVMLLVSCAEADAPSCPDGWARDTGRCTPSSLSNHRGPDALAADDVRSPDATADASPRANAEERDAASAADPTPTPDDDACDPAPQGEIRLAELLIDPEGADQGAEFIELTAPAGTRLDGVELVHRNGLEGVPYAHYRLDGVVGPSGRWVLGGEWVEPRDAELPVGLQNGPDGLELLGCDGRTLDAVVYGAPDTEFAWRDSEPAMVETGQALLSCRSGAEPDAERWQPAAPTPGEATSPLPTSCAACVPAPPGSVRINEIRYDPPGADGSGEAEFIELHVLRSLPAGAVELMLIEGRDGVAYTAPVVLPALAGGTYFVLGGPLSSPDAELPRALQNGPDGVALRACDGSVMDALGYGEVAAGVAEGMPAPEAPGGVLGRQHGAPDTDDNARDFVVLSRASPGAPNVP